MWLKTKIISSDNAPKKTLKDYLPELTIKQWQTGARRLWRANIDIARFKIPDDIWLIFIAHSKEVITIIASYKEGYADLAYDKLSELLMARPELAEKLGKFARPLHKIKTAVGTTAGGKYLYQAYAGLMRILKERPELAEDLSDLVKVAVAAGKDTRFAYDSLYKLLKARPALVQRLGSFANIFRKIKAVDRECTYESFLAMATFVSGRTELLDEIDVFIESFVQIGVAVGEEAHSVYRHLEIIIEKCPKLANKLEGFILLSRKFRKTSLGIYEILLDMILEGLLGEDNFDQVVQELLRDGKKPCNG